MSGEPFDLSDIVKVFNMTIKTPELQSPESDVFTWEFPSPTIDINMTADGEFILAAMKEAQKNQAVMKMEQRGRFWFDPAFDADVVMKELQYNPIDGSFTAVYNSMSIRDKTNQSYLARFLRWVLRR